MSYELRKAEHFVFVTLVFVACSARPIDAASAQQASANQGAAASQWIPFVATLTESNRSARPGPPVTLEQSGVYVRDSSGRSFNRRNANLVGSTLATNGPTFVAFLFDRPNGISYTIDFSARKIKKEMVRSMETGLLPNPITRETFDGNHLGDEFLGKMLISGVECEGFKRSINHRKGWDDLEEWFAPSLDFFVVKAHGHLSHGNEVSILLSDIHVGQEPDPKYFRLPEGFKLVK
jgi:hypothetical protein